MPQAGFAFAFRAVNQDRNKVNVSDSKNP
jgi:hypothetical protein